MKVIILFTVITIFCHHAFSQYQGNNWVFGDSVGLNFSTSPPSTFVSNITTYESCASISDNFGNLLFYTNGQQVWNRNNEVMPNGDSLDCGQNLANLSSITQGVIIIPKPKFPNLLYIFYLSIDNGLEYSIVDISLDGGLGDITVKNVPIFDDLYRTEKMHAVKHGNGEDWWLVIYSYPEIGDDEIFENGDVYNFVKFKITSEVIDGPFLQTYGASYDLSNFFSFYGQMKFSPDGTKLICPMGKDLDIYDFNRCTGEFSNYINIDDVDLNTLSGAEFSPSSTKLYVSTAGYPDGIKHLYLYCLDCGGDISSTKNIIYTTELESHLLEQMQLGIDDKIYVGSLDYFNWLENIDLNTYLHVISNPNEVGNACNFDTLKVDLNEQRSTLCLPNIPNYNLGPLVGSECDTLETSINSFNKSQKVNIYPNPASDHIFISGVNSGAGVIQIELYNARGELVLLKEKLDVNTKIGLSIIDPGIYALVIKEDDLIIGSEKLIVIKNK